MTASTPEHPPSAAALKATFDRASEYTVGIEEELLVLDMRTLELTPRAPEVLSWLDRDPRFKLELPASQIEIVTGVHATAADAAAELMAARRDLAEKTAGGVRFAGAGVSPLGSGIGELNALPRYQWTVEEYGPVIRRQLVCAFQVHVSVPGSERALAVYNHARTYLPLLAALAANGAFYEGRDSGLASMRPKLAELLPRQRIPPSFESWDQYADALGWGHGSGAFPHPGTWWWELRPHPGYGTLEFRVPDSQPTVAAGAALAAVIQALVIWLARRHDAGEQLPTPASWRIEENRWSACRYGVEGRMVDLPTAARYRTRQLLDQLLEMLTGVAAGAGTTAELGHAAEMIRVNGAIAQRQAAAKGGARAVARELVERFLEPWPG